jgi:acyl dehydratase
MISVGQTESVKRAFGQNDLDRFAALSGDDNPIHVDPEFASQTRFGRTVTHGMLLYSAVCGVLGSRLPGPGTLQLEQELMFPSPTFVGEEVTLSVEITQIQSKGQLADLNTLVVKPDGKVGLQGRTLVCLPETPLARLGDVPSVTLSDPSASASLDVSFKGLEIGQRAETRRVFTDGDLAEYAELAGDANPFHMEAVYARQMGYNDVLIPGGLLGGLFSYLLGTRLPGRGTNYLKQRLHFPAPAYPGQELAAAVEIIRLRPEKQLVNLRTICTGPAGQVVCHGEALVLVQNVRSQR